MAWNIVSNWTPSGGPLGPGGAGSILQDGWIDVTGSTWEITAGNLAEALYFAQGSGPANILSRPASEAVIDNQLVCTFTFNATGTAGPIFYLRSSGALGSTFQAYAIAIFAGGFNFATILNGLFPASGSSESFPFVDGQSYTATMSAVQTTLTETTIQISVLNNTTGIQSAIYGPAPDTTPALQNQVGVAAIQDVRASSGGTPTTFTNVITYNDITQASGYDVTGPTYGTHGSPSSPFTVRSNGILTAPATVTPSDGGAGGTFSPTSVTLAAGNNTGGTFTYTSLNRVVKFTFTNSAGLMDFPPLYFAAPQWSLTESYTPTGGPTSPGGAGSNAGGGWTDVTGNTWSINSGDKFVSAYNSSPNTGVLCRPSSENAFDVQTVWTGELINNDGSAVFVMGRYFHTTGGTNGYGVDLTPTVLSIFKLVNGVPVDLSFVGVAAPVTDSLSLTVQVIQIQNGVSTLIIGTLYDNTTSATIGTISITDTTAALQTIVGVGAIIALPVSNLDPSSQTSNLKTYTDAGTAQNYFILGPTSGLSGSPSAVFTLYSGGVLASPVTVNLSDSGGGGTFNTPGGGVITSVTLAAGTNTSAQFTYTPGSQGAKSLVFTNTGGLANNANLTYHSYLLTTVTPDNAAFKYSPGNWTGNAGRGGSTFRRTWNLGAYLQFNFNAQANPTLNILANLSNTGSQMYVVIVVNGAFNQNVLANGQGGGLGGGISVPALNGFVASGSNVIEIFMQSSPESARWNGGANSFIFTGVEIDTLSSMGAAPTTPPQSTVASKGWVFIPGDSLEEYVPDNSPAGSNAMNAWSVLLGLAYAKLGYDFCVSSCGYNGWIRPGDSTADVPPYYLVEGGVYQGDSSSRWLFIDQSIPITDVEGYISAYGQLNQQPSYVFQSLGTNDAFISASLTDVGTAIDQWMTKFRAAAPACKIVMLAPFTLAYSGYVTVGYTAYLTEFLSAVATYQAANPGDTNAVLVNLGNEMANTLLGPGPFTVLPHIYGEGHALITPQIYALALAAFPTAILNFIDRFH